MVCLSLEAYAGFVIADHASQARDDFGESSFGSTTSNEGFPGVNSPRNLTWE
jgi:hypothetical protein